MALKKHYIKHPAGIHEWLQAENDRECQQLLKEPTMHADYCARQLVKSEAQLKPTVAKDKTEPVEVTVLPVPSESNKNKFVVYSNVQLQSTEQIELR